MNISHTLFTARPNCTGRLDKEKAVYALLDSLSIPYTGCDHEHADTIEQCRAVEAVLGVEICKNLFLANTQGTVFHLLLMPGDKKFKTKDFSKQIGSARLSFGDAGHLLEYLDITPGSVSVLGLMNDREHHVALHIDRELLSDEYIGCHPCINTSTLKLRLTDITEKLLPHLGYTLSVVDLPRYE